MSSRHPRSTKHGKPADPSFVSSSSLHADFSADSNTSISCSFARLDYLFCNAGMLPVSGSRYSIILLSCLFCQMGCFLSTGRCVAVTNPWARASTVCLQTYHELACCCCPHAGTGLMALTTSLCLAPSCLKTRLASYLPPTCLATMLLST